MKRILFGLMLIVLSMNGATYYVRSDGGSATRCTGLADAADPGSGTGQACAWNLAGYMASTSSADDVISWRCGDTFRGLWTTRGAGSSGHPVTHTRYGSACSDWAASNPKVKGSVIPTPWSDIGSNRWTATVSIAEPLKVHFNGTLGTKAASQAAVDATNEWYWSGNTLTVYSTSDPATAFTSPGVEASVYSTPLSDIKHAFNTVNYVNFLQSNYVGVVIEAASCKYQYAITGEHVRHGLNCIGNGANCEVRYVRTYEDGLDSYGNGFYFSGYDCSTCGTSIGEFLLAENITGSGITFHGSDGGVVRYSVAHNSKWGLNCGDAANGKTMTFDAVLAHNNSTSDLYVLQGSEFGMGSTTCDVRNSLFYGTDIGVTVGGTGAAGGSNYVFTMRNTALFGHTTLPMYLDAAADLASYSGSDYNLFKNAASGYIIQANGSTYTEAQIGNWRTASSDDAHTKTGDPGVFNASNGYFQPVTGSALMKAGTDLGTGYGFNPRLSPLHSTWPNWSVVDFDKRGWNIGPFANVPKVVGGY